MSICVYGRIQQKCIDENLLEKLIIEYFCLKNNIIKEKKEKCITYEGIDDKNEVIISFINEKKPPYNVYDTDIIGGEFEYVQLIIFDIMKEEASIDKYKDIIKFFIYLKEKINSDVLVTSDVHDDICLLRGKEVKWSKDLSFDCGNIN